jgi:hypothetical protein
MQLSRWWQYASRGKGKILYAMWEYVQWEDGKSKGRDSKSKAGETSDNADGTYKQVHLTWRYLWEIYMEDVLTPDAHQAVLFQIWRKDVLQSI